MAWRISGASCPQHRRIWTSGGWLLLEHGFRQAAAVQNLLKQAGFESIRTLTDLAGQPRVTEGRLTP